VQSFVSASRDNPKTIRNCIMTLRMIWNSATAWSYVTHDPFRRLILPEYIKPEQPCFTPEQGKAIIEKLAEPYRTAWWVLAESGIRRGEVCGLKVGSVLLDANAVVVRNAVSCGKLSSTKAKRSRVFAISNALCERLKLYMGNRPSDAPLFTNSEGNRLDPDNLVKRHLKPAIKALGLEGAAHAFRHGNATIMDGLNVPMKTRQSRFGHVDPNTTMG
jgi:integrase